MLGLAVPNLFVLPFGTALGIYALWVLLHEETRETFLEGAAEMKMDTQPRKTAIGLDPERGRGSRYALGWMTGILFFLTEPREPVRPLSRDAVDRRLWGADAVLRSASVIPLLGS